MRILFWAFGFAFMFGTGNGWIGYQYFFLQGVPRRRTGSTGVAFLAFFLFQFAFADTAQHDRVGRDGRSHGFKGDLLYSSASAGSSTRSSATGSGARTAGWPR